MYSLGTVTSYAKSIIALANYEDTAANSITIKQMIRAGREGDDATSDKLSQLAMKGDIPTLTSLFEEALFGNNSSDLLYVTKVMEAASITSHPLVVYTLGRIYTKIEAKFEDAHRIIVELAPVIENLAEEGNTLAECHMGWLCECIYLSYHKALNWYGKASLNGSIFALYNLGILYSNGIFLGRRMSETEPEQGDICIIKCAELGYIPAQETLAQIALHKKDYPSAMKWFERSMLQGYIPNFLERRIQFMEGEEKQSILTLAKRLAEN